MSQSQELDVLAGVFTREGQSHVRQWAQTTDDRPPVIATSTLRLQL